MPHPHPLRKLLNQKPSGPGIKVTTAMTIEQWNELHELKCNCNVAVYQCGTTDGGMVIVALSNRKGSKAKIREWLRWGRVTGK
jgi:aerobic-type carbon monoxide dehydrogenase small subunit (CoxS/CutS family)